jgi:hypothetical protein
MANGPQNGTDGKDGKAGGLTPVSIAAAYLALAGLAAIGIFLLSNLGMSQRRWDRANVVYTSVEAIAFAGAGYLFGREVNKVRAEKAEEKADQKDKEATASAKDAAASDAKGQALAGAIRAFSPSSGAGRGFTAAATGATAPPGSAEALRSLADDLYPQS